MSAAFGAYWAARSPRERQLLIVAAGFAAALGLGLGLRALVDDLAVQRARVAGRERELAQVRRLAARLRREGGPVDGPVDATTLVTRIETAATDAVGRERIASMTPADGDGHMEVRVTGASLDDVVRLLHTLEGTPPPLAVVRLALRKYPDDPRRFDATLEVAAPGPAEHP